MRALRKLQRTRIRSRRRFTSEVALDGLHLNEFFLLLSSTGLAYRRCELVWVNGEQIGVSFLKPGKRKRLD
jgi:hypothetical protein